MSIELKDFVIAVILSGYGGLSGKMLCLLHTVHRWRGFDSWWHDSLKSCWTCLSFTNTRLHEPYNLWIKICIHVTKKALKIRTFLAVHPLPWKCFIYLLFDIKGWFVCMVVNVNMYGQDAQDTNNFSFSANTDKNSEEDETFC